MRSRTQGETDLKIFKIVIISVLLLVGLGLVLLVQKQQNFGASSDTREWVFDNSKKLVRSLVTTQGTLISNSGSTATTSAVALEVIGSSLLDNATTTNFAITGFVSCSAVETDSTGAFLCGTDDSGGSGSSAWEATTFTALTPTNTSAGIFVNASSTINSTLRVTGTITGISTIGTQGGFLANDGSSSAPGYRFNSDGSVGLYRPGTDILGFTTNGEAMRITAARLVGIGTTAPGAMLTASTTDESTKGIQVTLSGTTPLENAFEINTQAGVNLTAFTASGGLLMNIASTTALNIQNGSGTSTFKVDSITGSATTTILTVTSISGSTQCLQADTNGLVSGTGSACGAGGGGSSNWQATGFSLNALTPTNTSAGIFVNASSTFNSTLIVNGRATTSASLIVGTTVPSAFDPGVGDLLVGSDATVTASLTLKSITGTANNCLQVDTNGLVSGTSAACGGSAGAPGAWEQSSTISAALSPTSTSNGIFVNASSTFNDTLRVNGTLTAGSGGATDSLLQFYLGTEQKYIMGTDVSANIWAIASGTASDLGTDDNLFSIPPSHKATSTLSTGLVVATSTLVVNAPEQRVGIGTLVPSTTLGLLGTSRFNGAMTIAGALTINTITGSTQCLQVDTNGLLAGSGAACGGSSGAPGAWETVWANAITPTNTSAGIFVRASSTIAANFRVDGKATSTSALWVGSSGTANNLDLASGDLYVADDLEVDGDIFGSFTRSKILEAASAIPTIGDDNLATTTQAVVLYGTNRQSLVHLDFPNGAASSSAQWTFDAPANYDGGSFTATIYHTATSTGENVRWCMDAVSYADSDALDATWGSLACWSGQFVGTANDIVVSSSTSVTAGGTPTGGETIQFRLTRGVSDDDDREDMGRVVKVKLGYTTTKISE